MGKSFDLGNTLADVLGKVSDPDRAPEQIVLIDLPLIDADERNFYSVEGVEELAANIELVGLLDPLRVRENPDLPGRYLIVSGHRRRAALWTLYEEDPERWGKAPCIIEPAAASPELQELRLIYANADTRRMSSADLSKQAERVEMLLYKLKDQGMEFPGRMRDHVAEACKVSATKLAELKVIREKLEPDWRRLWEENKINHSIAYTIAKEDPDIQRRLAFEYTPAAVESWAQWQVEQAIETVRDPAPHPDEPPEPAFDPSAYQKQLDHENALLRKAVREGFGPTLAREINRYSCYYRQQAIDRLKKCFRNRGHCGPNVIGYDGYPNGIKVDVPGEEKFLAHWTDLFDQLALYAIEELARRNEQERPAPAAPAQQTLQFRSRTPEWISPENMLPADGVQVLILDENGDVDIDRRHDGDWFFTKKESVMFWAPIPPVPGEDVEEYYIEPGEPAAAPQQADAGTLQFRSGTPDHDCVCWAIFQVDDLTSVHQARWKGGGWWLHNIEATIDAECIGWIELPDYEGVLRK